MGFRCTVFGHKWGEPGTERDRDDNGEEVVVTVREVRTCRRCGAEDVLGESTEVTAIDQSGDAPSGEDPPRGTDHGSADEERYDPASDDAVILDDDGRTPAGDDERNPREWPDRPERDDVDEGGEPAPWPDTARETEAEPPDERFVGVDRPDDRDDQPTPGITDDQAPEDRTVGAEIIDSGDDDRSTAPTEPVESDQPAHRDDTDQPTHRDDSDGPDDGQGSDGRADEERTGEGRTVDGGPADGRAGSPQEDPDPDPDPDPDRDAGEGPGGAGPTGSEAAGRDEPTDAAAEPSLGADATPRPEDDAEVLETTEPNEQSRATAQEPVDPTEHVSGATTGGAGRDRSDTHPTDEPGERDGPERSPEHIEFYCPECGYVDESEWPSRRAGDVCPDCQRSYLAERER